MTSVEDKARDFFQRLVRSISSVFLNISLILELIFLTKYDDLLYVGNVEMLSIRQVSATKQQQKQTNEARPHHH